MAPSARPPVAAAAAVLCLWLLVAVAEAKVHHYKWDISYQLKSPDCFEKLAVTVNGEAPGPTIHATQGDTIVVDVHNKLETENTAIHWHGIRQIDTPWADGVAGVTQCPILPGETFTYKFVVDRPGTYLYHAHYGMQRVAGLNGMIVVKVPDGIVEPFFTTRSTPSSSVTGGTRASTSRPRGSPPTPSCSSPSPSLSSSMAEERSTARSLPVEHATPPAPTALCRLCSPPCRGRHTSSASAASHRSRRRALRQTIRREDPLHLPGETYPCWSRPTRTCGETTGLRPTSLAALPAGHRAARLSSYAFNGNNPWMPPPTAPPAGPAWNNTAIRVEQSRAIFALPGHGVPMPARADRMLLLLNTQNRIDGYIKWTINGVSLMFPPTPYLVAMKRGMKDAYEQRPRPTFQPCRRRLEAAQREGSHHEEHGATAPGWVDGGAVPGGQPGVWLFHCHVEAHVFMGMGVVFEEGVERVGWLPSSIMGCGRSKAALIDSDPCKLSLFHLFMQKIKIDHIIVY
ncbi:hypothetical protein ZWY2020_010426 [Hordeum vulgare]|nr:hypothetical protein ZWY2020_010426 [Hordeum vulgare]